MIFFYFYLYFQELLNLEVGSLKTSTTLTLNILVMHTSKKILHESTLKVSEKIF